jgi:hypothetical protein
LGILLEPDVEVELFPLTACWTFLLF